MTRSQATPMSSQMICMEDMIQDREQQIYTLSAEVKRLTAALHEVVFAARTKISMKDVARKALFYQPQGVTNASSDPPIK